MSYNKIIKYGNTLELYEYERKPRVVDRRRRALPRNDAAHAPKVDLGADGGDAVSERKLGKRHDNSRRAKMDFRRLVAANLVGTELPVLITLTCKDNITDLSYGYKRFRAFIQALRYSYGKSFRYVAVPEFQKRGAVHFHALFWGLPEEVVSRERTTRAIAMKWGMGFVYYKKTDGHIKIASYLSKYMAKAFTDPRLRNQKAYVASRNVLRPEVAKGVSPLWPIFDDIKGSVAEVDEKYYSRYLGECRHRIFKRPQE
jgi:hypothetical protein